MTKKFDFVGKRFGRLLVLKRMANNSFGQTRWKCQCDCGNTKTIIGYSLKTGITKSCGCLQKEIASKYNSKDYGLAAQNAVLSSYKNAAKSRNYSFRLTDDEAVNLFNGDCHYCGAKPNNLKKHGNGSYKYNGIDRKNNNIGYTTDNCVSCCKRCNFFKGIMGYKDFLNTIREIFYHRLENEG